MIALLGRRDHPVDGVEDYCARLGEALARNGIELRIRRVPWNELGWFRGLLALWRESGNWAGQWAVLQYTALAWSRRGFPLGALAALATVKRRGVRCAVVFHESRAQPGRGLIHALRRVVQNAIVRRLARRADRAIFPEPLEAIPWLVKGDAKAISIPIGANLPAPADDSARVAKNRDSAIGVAVFCLSLEPKLIAELEDISCAVRKAAATGFPIRAIFVGRGTAEAEAQIRKALKGVAAGVIVHGLRPPQEVSQILAEADVMLYVRDRFHPCRGSAIAGIVCGLPVAGYGGECEGTPLENAGLALVRFGDRDALGDALARLVADRELRSALARKSRWVAQNVFAWERIAAQFEAALPSSAPKAVDAVFETAGPLRSDLK